MYASNVQDVEEWVYLRNVASNAAVYPSLKNRGKDRNSNCSMSSISSCSSNSNRSNKLKRKSSSTSSRSSNTDEILAEDQSKRNLEQENEYVNLEHKSNVDDEYPLNTGRKTDKRINLLADSMLHSDDQSLNNSNPIVNETIETMFTSAIDQSTSNREESLMHTNIEKNLNIVSSCIHSDRNSYQLLTWYALIALLFICPFFLGYTVARWDQPTVRTIVQELNTINDRLNGIDGIPSLAVEDKITSKLEKILQEIENQRHFFQNEQTQKLIQHFNDLELKFKLTQKQLTETIEKLIVENKNLKTQIEISKEKSDKIEEENVDSTTEIPSVEDFQFDEPSNKSDDDWSRKFHQWTKSFVAKTNFNVLKLVDNLGNSLGEVVHQGNEYVREIQEKFVKTVPSLDPDDLAEKFCRKLNSFTTKFYKNKIDCDEYFRAKQTSRTSFESSDRNQDQSYSSFAAKKLRSLKNRFFNLF